MLTTQYSAWFIPLCLLVGAGYAALQYSAKAPWSRNLNYALAALRFAVVSFLCYLLLGPFIKTTTTHTEQPTIVLAVDNSQSVELFTPKNVLSQATAGLARLAETLRSKGFTVETRTLTPTPGRPARLDSLRFVAPTTDLDRLLSGTREAYDGRNLAGVVLLSDGLVNQGRSPAYSEYSFPIYSVAVGDTVPKKDLRLTGLTYNRVAFSGNRFPVEAEIGFEGFAGGAATVELREGNRVLESRRVTLPAGRRRVKATFQITAPAPGKRRYEVRVVPQPGEFTELNNARTAFIEIVKGKLRVLLAGAAPHPDLKALRAAILANNNFDLTLALPGVAPLRAGADFDVAILHQIPAQGGLGNEILAQVKARRTPALYIIGAQSDLAAYNQLGTGLTIQPRGAQTDEVTPLPNPGFARFATDEESVRRFAAYPPAPVPFGDLRLGAGAEAALWQRVGRVATQKPLLVFGGTTDRRQATLLTDGSWQWRLQEAVEHDDKPEAYDRLIIRTLQLLTQNANKKRLDVYPTQESFGTQDDVTLGAETYNAVFERIYNQRIDLTLTDEKQQTRRFTFANPEDGAPLHLGPLPAGLYRYQARATLGGQAQQDAGELVVQSQPLEALESRADHNLLAQLSRRSGSRLYYPAQFDQLAQDIQKANYKPVITAEEDLKDLINLKWIFFVILAFLTAEWATRKYSGSV
ncbi:VWA domain-containing protein [Hymenobacter sp. BT770]|uniref:VWA domain-containing protein n=1 Tax=Hymenobacter sp. BT770 TaxID=2886942 RepID=UPI001D10B8C6|nr:VWA domain-containing protein [Hymenobacter sp. BT770]MCC3153949.1 VWA domain-containing protein [Hymenobacter sp. BT770]MDO3416121.1 VWA domain-containing protein [Hymenobacter sp. BT770]